MRTIIFIIVQVLITINCTAQLYEFSLVPDNLKKNASAIVRTEQMVYRVTGPGKAIVTFKKAVTILNEKSDDYRYLSIGYDNYSRVKSLKGNVYDEKGTIIKALGMIDANDISAVSGGSFYTDDRLKTLIFPIHRYPYTIEYEYEKEYTSILTYPGWSFQDAHDVAVVESGFQIIIPEDMNLRYYEENVKNSVDSVTSEGMKIYTWKEDSIRAYLVDETAIEQNIRTPYINTAPLVFEYGGYEGSMSSWKELGKWAYEINKDRDKLPEEEIATIKTLISGITGTREKINKIYSYMQSKTRYLSVQIDIGGFQTAKAEAVSKNGFGDCKALVNYTKALLGVAGINSYYTLVDATSADDIELDFVDHQFDHVILAVPVEKDTLWLECTSQTIPPNTLGSYTRNKHGLLLSQSGGTVVKIPDFKPGQNKQITTASMYLTSAGIASGKVQNIYAGSFYQMAQGSYFLQSPDEIRRSLNNSLRFSNLSISQADYSEVKDNNPSGYLTYQAEIKDFSATNGNSLFFNPVINIHGYLPEVPFPIQIPLATHRVDSIVYTLPLNSAPEYVPEDLKLTTDFGTYEYSITVAGDRLILLRKLELKKLEIPTDEYDKIKSFINAIAEHDRKRVILKLNQKV